MVHWQRIAIVFSLLAWLGVSAALPTAVRAEARDLADRRWSEQKFGLSLKPPVNSRMIQQTHDDYLVRFIDGDRAFQLTAMMKRSREPVGLMDIAEGLYMNTLAQFTAPGRAKIEVDGSEVFDAQQVGDKEAAVAYLYPDTPEEPAMIAQAVVLVDPHTFAVIEMRGAAAEESVIKPTFQAVLDTVRFADQQQVAEQRKAAVEATLAWRDQLSRSDYEALAGRQAHFRILGDEEEEDVGWLIMETREGEFAGKRGLRVRIKMHLALSDRRIDSLGDYFRPYAGFAGEAWSERTTVRQSGTQQARSTVETGTTTAEHLRVTLDGTSGSKSRNLRFMRPRSAQWQRLQSQLAQLRAAAERDEADRQTRRRIEDLAGQTMALREDPWAYLPQADAWLVGYLLPRDVSGTYGFYAYHGESESISYRTKRVTPTLRGYTVHSRPTPNVEARKSTYDGEGRLIRKELGGGRILKRSDLRSLQSLWKLR